MNTGKLFKAFITIAALVALSLSAYAILNLKTISNNMTVSNISALEVLDEQSNPITSWSWGTFELGEVKMVNFILKNIGNTVLNVNASITDLPLGWSISLSETSWTIAPGASANLTISLRLDEALPVGSYSFSLNFYVP